MKVILMILKLLFHERIRYSHLLAFIKYNSLKKLINLFHNEFERRIKKVLVSSKPYLINSEPTNHCNCKCLFCPTGKSHTRPGGYAQVETYEKTFHQIGRYTYLITIHGWGEPTTYKNLPDIISLAHENRIYTVVTTNGNLLTREMSKKIISGGLDYLIFSLDGISEESYQKYRIGGRFEMAISNLKELIALKKEMRSSTPFIEWQFIVFKHNEHEIEVARTMAKELGVNHIVFMPAYTEDPSFDASDKKYHLPKSSPLLKRSDCKHLWSTLAFHWNGNVVSCCYDYDEKIAYGNILEDSLNKIWNNEKFQESRMIVKNGPNLYSKDLYCSACVQNIQKS